MKKLFIALAAVAASSMMTYADGNYLHIKTSEGWSVLDLEQVDRLSFSDNVMTATSASGETLSSYPQDQLEKMFANDAAGVADLKTDNKNGNFVLDGKTVTMLADSDFAIYSTDGTALVEIPAVKNGEKIDLSALTPGVYVAKSGNQSQKISLK